MVTSEFDALHIKTCLFTDEHLTIRSIRENVFQSEQGIAPTLDWDGQDNTAIHLIAKLGETAVGIARLREIETGIALKLERLAVLPTYRHQGIGSEIVHTAIAYSKAQGYQRLVIHAQVPTVEFYRHLGFQAVGEPFVEAGITHLKMERSVA
jgi:predicted GNAT family N-acyltransferase